MVFFGTSGDTVNLKERYERCSYNRLRFVPWSGTTTSGFEITNGVATVTINMNVIEGDKTTIHNAVTSAATELLGDLPSQFDYVAMSVPPGSAGGWLAYAYVNHWLSVFNDVWITSVSAQVHEIGHNLNLAHAGESAAYDDQSGYMGYSYSGSDTPAMCFNGAKSWQLGWYSNAYAMAKPLEGAWTGSLVGVVDYDGCDSSDGTSAVVVKVETNEDLDYYVAFNKGGGINSGTNEGEDQVMITTTTGNGVGYASSQLVAKLIAGEDYVIDNFGSSSSTVTIRVGSISLTARPPHASVSIFSGEW